MWIPAANQQGSRAEAKETARDEGLVVAGNLEEIQQMLRWHYCPSLAAEYAQHGSPGVHTVLAQGNMPRDSLSADTHGRTAKAGAAMFDWNRQSVGEDMLTKSDPEMERVARKYVEDMMGKPCGDNLFEDLKDGKVLCALVNKIQPGIVKKVNKMNIAAMQMENISFFLDALLEVPPLSFPSSAHAYARPTAAAKPADPVAPICVRPCSSGSSKRVASGPPISGMVRYANTCTPPANSRPPVAFAIASVS